jgi:hypothetical protein
LEAPLLKDHPSKFIYNSFCGIRDNHPVCEKSNKTGTTSSRGTAYFSIHPPSVSFFTFESGSPGKFWKIAKGESETVKDRQYNGQKKKDKQ